MHDLPLEGSKQGWGLVIQALGSGWTDRDHTTQNIQKYQSSFI